MKRIFDIAKNTQLFKAIAFSDFEPMLNCLSVRVAKHKKNDIILLSGDTVNFVGLVLSGSVKIIKEDIDGKITLLTSLGISEVFGEVFACAGIDHSPVTIIAAEDSEIMMMDYKKIVHSCTNACMFHTKLIENMMKLLATKNLQMNQKIEILSKRSTREKLLSFFDAQRGAAKKFTIPYSREELADYLCVDRSAMSNELSKMRDEGLIAYKKNVFELLL